MADYGASYTDAELKKLEKKIGVVYKQAEGDLNKKIKDFNNKYKAKEAKYLKELAAGKITQEQFDSWKAGQVFQGKQWQAKKDQIANTLFHANDTATKIMNGQMVNVFTTNANFMSYSLEKNAGVNFGFGLYDSATVSNLLKADQKLLPEWKINEQKDYKWNNKRVNRAITQSIIQGEKLDQIADRLCDRLVTQNKNKMLTFARTSMTCAQNAGREYSLNAAKDLGINVEKEWMCTLDGRTRDWHRQLDGQRRPLNKPFEVDGLKIRYPGDPEAKPGLVYNCRCTMVGDLIDYPSTYNRYDNIDGKPIKGMTYQEWEAAKAKGENISPVPLTWKKFVEQNTQISGVINGTDISNTWERRPEKFDFEIEDVINAQGFDGKPRIVSAEEFDDYVKRANGGNGFIAQRTYSASDQEILDMYRDQLYNGKWYVDCSTGGAQYGQGMYCAADYSGNLTEGIKTEMGHYKNLGESRFSRRLTPDERYEIALQKLPKDISEDAKGYLRALSDDSIIAQSQYYVKLDKTTEKMVSEVFNNTPLNASGISYTETLTLDPSAKIITYKDLGNLRQKEISNNLARLPDLASKGDMKEIQRINAYAKKINDMDYGSYAAMKGYDAINAEGHGGSGSYTVILNRTKLIIKGK